MAELRPINEILDLIDADLGMVSEAAKDFLKLHHDEYISLAEARKVGERFGYPVEEVIESLPIADVQPVAETENMATISDEFICKRCGIYIKDYIKVVMDEDNDGYIDEQHYEYEPKFCPECGAKVKDGDTNG